MKLSTVHDYLKDESCYIYVVAEAGNEVKEYSRLSKKKGASMPIILEEDVNEIEIGMTELRIVCSSFLKGHLDKYFISYITDALLLSQKVSFESESIREAFELLTDPEINGELTKERVIEMLVTTR